MKKQNKNIRLKFFTFILVFSVILNIVGFLNVPVYAIDVFSDVHEDAYYYEAVQEMAEKGYVNGYGDSTFRPLNYITLAESITLLYRIAGYDVVKTQNPEKWYSDVWTEAQKMGLVTSVDDPDSYATRLDIAKYIIKLYQIDVGLTTVEHVFVDTDFIVANTMYQYGIFIGSPTANGVAFMPNSNITRGDISLVLYRLNEKIESPYIGELVLGSYIVSKNPDTLEDYLKIMLALGESGELSIQIPYTRDLNNISYYLKIRENAISAFERSFSMYPEYFSFTPTLTLKREIKSSKDGSITLTISNKNLIASDIQTMRKEFDESCDSILNELYSYGVITEETSTLDKVRIFYEYVALHCSYDYTYSVNSFTGYGAAVEGKAVCQGYTAMLNNLCRKAGLKVIGITGTILETDEAHMWSAVFNDLDSSWIYCDVTFGDTSLLNMGDKDSYDLTYFNISEEDLMVGRQKDWE